MRLADLQRKRKIKNHLEFYDKTMKEIEKSFTKIKHARLRKGLYKYFFEEYVVLLEYVKLKYKNNENIYFRWIGKQQQGKEINYDGEIFSNNELIEKIEITCPLISKNDYIEAKQLNEYGSTEVEIGSLNDALRDVKDKIINMAERKNNKKTYDNTITLIVYMQDWKHFYDDVDICDTTLDNMMNELRSMNFKFKEMYLLCNINNYKKLIKIK